MKTTISNQPNENKIEFPCLMNLKTNKDHVYLVNKLNGEPAHCKLTRLTGMDVNDSFLIREDSMLCSYEFFVGELTLQND